MTMRLSLSNLAWDHERNDEIYWFMQNLGIDGLEIAPTKIFGENPYDDLPQAKQYFAELNEDFSIIPSSMQSIWYKRQEKLFGSVTEREVLFEHTRKAVEFAAAIGCENLVFGSPKNRVIGDESNRSMAIDFFRRIGDCAKAANTVIAVEANPTIYGTDFLNTTAEALEFCREVGNDGIRVNLDFGTILVNKETLHFSKEDVSLFHHVHISEPNLKPIRERVGHNELKEILERYGYNGFVSVEMGVSEEDTDILDAAVYLKEVFG